MSLTGSAETSNLNILRGKISKVSPYAIDPSLTTEGAAADAKATGEAIKQAANSGGAHARETDNPHKVTKDQVGLGFVDNTADTDKPVSTKQAEAIADAKKAGTDAMAEASKKTEKIAQIVTLTKAGWSGNTQTVSVADVTENVTLIVCTNPANSTEYADCVIRCTDQHAGSLTFTCDEVPSIDILVNVLILL